MRKSSAILFSPVVEDSILSRKKLEREARLPKPSREKYLHRGLFTAERK